MRQEGVASAKVPREEHPWLVPGTDWRSVWLECNMQGRRRWDEVGEGSKPRSYKENAYAIMLSENGGGGVENYVHSMISAMKKYA